MANVLGSKRSSHPNRGQSELQKKKKTISLGGKGDNVILVEAGSNPARTNESFMLELLGTWELRYRKSACRIGVGKRSLCCVFSRDMDG